MPRKLSDRKRFVLPPLRACRFRTPGITHQVRVPIVFSREMATLIRLVDEMEDPITFLNQLCAVLSSPRKKQKPTKVGKAAWNRTKTKSIVDVDL